MNKFEVGDHVKGISNATFDYKIEDYHVWFSYKNIIDAKIIGFDKNFGMKVKFLKFTDKTDDKIIGSYFWVSPTYFELINTPIITNEMKAIEVFGNNLGIDCYRESGTDCPFDGNLKSCAGCNCEYYKDSEYHAPDKE